MNAQARDAIAAGTVAKGDVMAAARIAGIMAAKHTVRSHSSLSSASHYPGLSLISNRTSVESLILSTDAHQRTNRGGNGGAHRRDESRF